MKAVTRDENGTYYINARLANTLIGALLLWAIGTIGYMADWNRNDAIWKASKEQVIGTLLRDIDFIDRRIDTMAIDRQQIITNTQHLREIDNRLDRLERQ